MVQKGKDISQDQQVNFLRKIDFFHDFDNHELRQLLAVTNWLKLPENSLVIEEGAFEQLFYILVKGTVAVFKTNSETGERTPLTTLQTGDCFGEMSLVSEMPRTAGVVTTTECFLLKVEPDIIKTSNVFLQLKFFQRFCEILVSRLIEANQRMVSLEKDITHQAQQPRQKVAPSMVRRQVKTPQAPGPLIKKESAPGLKVKQDVLPAMPKAIGKKAVTRMQRRVAGVDTLAVNPEITERISPFLYGTEQNTRKFADIISLDPYLSFRVIQLANSSFYRRATPVLTVPHAMIVVGVDTLLEIIREAIDASNEIGSFGGFPKKLGGLYWRNSIVVGRIANLLKEILRINITPDVYLAGLFYRLGTLVLDRLEPAFYPQLLREGNEFPQHLCASETEYIGAEHGPVGAWFGQKMGVPPPYLEVMRNYNTPQKAKEHPLLCALIHLAARFAIRRGVSFGNPLEEEKPLADAFAWMLIQEQQNSFVEADIPNFIADFEAELTNTWNDVFGDLG